jgi:hypothetical protein
MICNSASSSVISGCAGNASWSGIVWGFAMDSSPDTALCKAAGAALVAVYPCASTVPREGVGVKRRAGMLHTARLTIVYLLVPILLLMCIPIPGSSSDAQGNYVALGFGLESCQSFLHARSNGLALYYRHWVTGYLTAANKLTKDTMDMRGTTDIDGMLGLREQYCIQNRQYSFSRAVEFLRADLYPSMCIWSYL